MMLRMTYGYTPKRDGTDPLIDLIETWLALIIHAMTPGIWIVDFFPFLQYFPSWFPGTGFRKVIHEAHSNYRVVQNMPYDFVRRHMAAGTNQPSFMSRLLEEADTISDPEQRAAEITAIKTTASTMYGAATETSSGTLMVFLLAMIKFPEVQRKAQEEIDRVIGSDRLPGFQDLPNLPYVSLVAQETYRWFPASTLAVPHVAKEDLTARGYSIPKGSMILPSIYWFTQDSEVYANPSVFEPERYMKPREEPNPRGFVFGYGRRKCPGRFFADSVLLLNVAQTLAVFNLKKVVGPDGVEIEPLLKPTPGVASHPKPFPITAVPRSAKHAELVRKLGYDLSQDQGDAHELNCSNYPVY